MMTTVEYKLCECTKLNTSCVSAAQTSGGAALAFCSGSSLCGVTANLLDNTI